jgi:hypothetical protein
MQVGGSFYPFIAFCRLQGRNRNVGLSQNGGDFVGAIDCGSDNDDARQRSRSGTFRGGATGARSLFGKVPRWLQCMQQSMYLQGSNEGRMERWRAHLH